MAESKFTGLPVEEEDAGLPAEEEDAKETKKINRTPWSVGDQILDLLGLLRNAYSKPDATPAEKNAPFEIEANIEALAQLRRSDQLAYNQTVEDIAKITKLGKENLRKALKEKVDKYALEHAPIKTKEENELIKKQLEFLKTCPFISAGIGFSGGITIEPDTEYITKYLINEYDLMAIHNENQEEGLALWRRAGNEYSQLSKSDLFLIKEMQEVMKEWELDRHVEQRWINRLEILRQVEVKSIVQPVKGMFPVANGILDIQNMKLLTDDDGKICLVRSGVKYDPEAKCPEFEKFLNGIFDGNQVKIEALLSWLGAIVAGLNPQIIVMLKSRGRSGKDVLMGLVTDLLGGMLTTNSPNDIRERFSNWAFLHRRLAFIEEFDGRDATVNAMKALSGGIPSVSFETKGIQAIMTAPVQCAIFINTNSPPSFEKGSAWEERFKLLDFPNSYLDEPDPRNSWEKKVDRSFSYRLKPELPGILNMVLPYARYALEHQDEPFKVDIPYKETADMLDRSSNSLERFIDEHCELAPLKEDSYGNMRTRYSDYDVTDTTFLKKYEEYCKSPEVNVTALPDGAVKKELKTNYRVLTNGHKLLGIRMKKNAKKM